MLYFSRGKSMLKIIKGIDKPLFIISIILFALGLVTIYSASNVTAYMLNEADPSRYFVKELIFLVCGFLMAGEFYWLDFIGYNWRINPNSMSRSRKRDADFLAGVWDVLNTLKSEMQRLNLYDEYTYNKYCATILGWHINEKFSFRRPYRQYYNKCRELFAKTDQRQLKPYWRFALKRIF